MPFSPTATYMLCASHIPALIPYQPKAFAVWQWSNYYHSQIPRGKTMLRLNLDETSVRLYPGSRKGVVFVGKKRPREAVVHQIPRWKRRCCMTHIGIICDRTDIQPELPQVIIANESTVPAGLYAALVAARPRNVRLVRQTSAWNNELLCAFLVRQLGTILAPYMSEVQPVLSFDSVRLHTTPRVLAACVRAGIWPLVNPPRMTWLLQPLDTHAFLPYKVHLLKAYLRARAASAAGDVDVESFLACVYAAIRQVLQGERWSTAFDRDGFDRDQAGLSATIRRELHIDGPLAVPASRPTAEQLALCFPRRARVPVTSIWKPFDHPSAPPHAPRGRAAAVGVPAVAAASASRIAAGDRVFGRTRSETRRLTALAAGRGAP